MKRYFILTIGSDHGLIIMIHTFKRNNLHLRLKEFNEKVTFRYIKNTLVSIPVKHPQQFTSINTYTH